MPTAAQRLREHVRAVSKQAEVIGALCKEFERQPRGEVLPVLKQHIEALKAEWDKAEAILTQ